MLSHLQRLGIAVLVFGLAACSSQMPRPTDRTSVDRSASSSPVSSVASPIPQSTSATPTPSVSSGKGTKIINIDPKPENAGDPTAGIDPEAPLETTVTPKLEPIVKGTTRPYIVNGETMTPMASVSTPFTQTGHASWYGKKFHGRPTASGEPYDMYKLTAAHRTLPIPSYVRVTNLSNGKTLVARVNDRGPFGRDRIIDLSYAAARQLDIIRHGSAKVEIVLINPAQTESRALPAPTVSTASETTRAVQPVAEATSSDSQGVAALPVKAPSALASNAVYVQVGAFGREENADRLQQRIFSLRPEIQSLLNKVYNGKVFQIVLGPYPDHALAAEAASQMHDQLQLPALIFSR